MVSHNGSKLCYNQFVAIPQSGNGKGVPDLDSFLLAVVASAVGSVLAYYFCKAMERLFGNDKR